MYVDYSSALEMCGLQTLHERREQRSKTLALKCLKTPTIQEIFPLNPTEDTHMIRDRERFKVNKFRTESYRNSAIPYLQRRLDSYFSKAKVRSRKEARARRGASVQGRGAIEGGSTSSSLPIKTYWFLCTCFYKYTTHIFLA